MHLIGENMTRLLFLPDEKTTLELESMLDPDALIDLVNSGEWELPQPWQKENFELCAFRQDNRVIVLPAAVLEEIEEEEENFEPAKSLQLSPRQCQILDGLARGLTLKELALNMGISRRTVSAYVTILKKRLGTSTLAQSISRAQSLGLYNRTSRLG